MKVKGKNMAGACIKFSRDEENKDDLHNHKSKNNESLEGKEKQKKTWLRGERLYERRKELKHKYNAKHMWFTMEFLDRFVHWFMVVNMPCEDKQSKLHVSREDVTKKYKELFKLVMKRRITHTKALDLFSDFVHLDRNAWRTHAVKRNGRINYVSLSTDVKFQCEPKKGFSQPKGSRWSKRLANVPNYVNFTDSCFGASKCLFYIRINVFFIMLTNDLKPSNLLPLPGM